MLKMSRGEWPTDGNLPPSLLDNVIGMQSLALAPDKFLVAVPLTTVCYAGKSLLSPHD